MDKWKNLDIVDEGVNSKTRTLLIFRYEEKEWNEFKEWYLGGKEWELIPFLMCLIEKRDIIKF